MKTMLSDSCYFYMLEADMQVIFNQIENGRVHPSLQAFFYICDYLKITPHQFFEDDNLAPKMLEELIEELKKLDAKTLELITDLVKQLNKGKE